MRDISTPGQGRHAAMVALANRQHGVVAHRQLVALGYSRSRIDRLVRGGLLISIHRGVYACGNDALRRRGWWWAALLAVRGDAVLSHFTAATVWDLLPARDRVHVSAPGRTGRARHRGVTVHRPRSLPIEETTVHDGLRTTSLARTLVDLCAVTSQLQLARALENAETVHRVDLPAIQRVLAHSRGRRGIGMLRQAIRDAVPGVTRSDLELAFCALVRDGECPLPELNVEIALADGGRHEADFLWIDRRLIIEVDGFETHGSRRAFVRDRQLDRRLRASGYEVERFSWDDVLLAPRETGTEVVKILDRHPPLVVV